jgi:hypothetical protein
MQTQVAIQVPLVLQTPDQAVAVAPTVVVALADRALSLFVTPFRLLRLVQMMDQQLLQLLRKRSIAA